jgi:putative peptidoglycan lipid II flippase
MPDARPSGSARDRGLVAAAFLVGAAGLASRIVGLLRDRLLAATFGAGAELDAYYAAFRWPDTIYNLLIVGALSAAFIPVFLDAEEKKGEEDAGRFATQAFVWTAGIVAIACAALFMAAPWLVPATVSGFPPERQRLAVELTRIMLCSPFFLSLSAVFGGALQAKRRFLAFSIAPVLYNIGIMAGVWVLAPSMGIRGAAWGVAMGAALHAGLQAVAALRGGIRWDWSLRPLHAGLRALWRMAPARVAGLAMAQVNFAILLFFAARQSEGGVAAMNFANNLQAVPVGLIGVSYAVAAFPALSEAAAKKEDDVFGQQVAAGLRRVLFFTIPLVAALFLLRAQAVRLALGAGNFDWTATIRTANALAAFLPSVPAQCVVALLARAFYARQDARTPLLVGLFAEVAVVAGALVAQTRWDVMGLAAAFSFGSVLQALGLAWMLRRRVCIPWRALVETGLASVAAGAAFIAAGHPVRELMGTVFPLQTFWQVLAQAAAAGAVGTAGFLLAAWVFRIPEFFQVKEALVAKLLRKKPEVASMEEVHDLG